MEPEWFLVEKIFSSGFEKFNFRRSKNRLLRPIRFFSFSRVIDPGLIYWDRSEGFVFNIMLIVYNPKSYIK